MRIKRAEVFTCRQPLKVPFTHASSGYVDHLDGVYVKLTTDENFAGYGEVRGNCSYFTGDSTDAVVSVIVSMLIPVLIGEDPLNLNRLHLLMDKKIVGNYAAKAACDCALYDLAGKILNQPVYQLLGGKLHDTLESEENIPFMSAKEAAERTRGVLEQGCRFIKVRVGAEDFSYDYDRVSAVWETIKDYGCENEVVFSMDANQAWNVRDAVYRINKLAELGVTIVEQPVKFNSPIRLRELKERCPMKLFGDESVATVEDLTRYLELGAVDGIHIKLIKCGGIYNAVRLMNLAKAHEIEFMIGGMDDGMLAVAAAVQCAAVAETKLFEVHGHVRIAKDPVKGLKTQGSVVYVPENPGLGVTVDESQMTRVFG